MEFSDCFPVKDEKIRFIALLLFSLLRSSIANYSVTFTHLEAKFSNSTSAIVCPMYPVPLIELSSIENVLQPCNKVSPFVTCCSFQNTFSFVGNWKFPSPLAHGGTCAILSSSGLQPSLRHSIHPHFVR